MNIIVPSVHQVAFGYVNAFVLDGGRTLVDAGPWQSGRRVLRELGDGGRALQNVLITHHHVDHIGPLPRVAPESVIVWAHPIDAAVIRGDSPARSPESRSGLERAGVWAVEHL